MFDQVLSSRTKIFFRILVVLFLIVWLVPLVSLISRSVERVGLLNYLAVLRLELFPVFFLNSIVIAGSTVIIRMFIVSLAAYAFSAMDFRFKNALFVIAIVGLFTPPFTLLVSLFQTVKTMGLLNRIAGVILPLVAFGVSFNTLLFRNYFDTIPSDFFDAADIDGADHWKKYRLILLPLGKPIILTGTVFTFLNSWNEFFLPLLLLRQSAKFPLTLSPYYFMSAYTSDYSKVYAAMIIISIPIILVYILGQRYLEGGLAGGGIKG